MTWLVRPNAAGFVRPASPPEQASLDEPNLMVVLHKTEPSRIQALALQLCDKVTNLVEYNERLWELKQGSFFGRNTGTSPFRVVRLRPPCLSRVAMVIDEARAGTSCSGASYPNVDVALTRRAPGLCAHAAGARRKARSVRRRTGIGEARPAVLAPTVALVCKASGTDTRRKAMDSGTATGVEDKTRGITSMEVLAVFCK
ncbi:hypothetical protein HPB47_022496 [Ixodes persulcatus]|uniref:Uncharacterized protein n=1 Tax=Ixodes persulcatus TaxID=34615 RepID=A0AC60Q9K5_IXOPE|nr:hypothetical protein HPB47_022496 [Ixodes persulcatus]